jgi:hypothetical protein
MGSSIAFVVLSYFEAPVFKRYFDIFNCFILSLFIFKFLLEYYISTHRSMFLWNSVRILDVIIVSPILFVPYDFIFWEVRPDIL